MEFPVWECDWIPILNSTLSVRWTSQRIHFQHVLKPRQQALDFALSPEHFPIDCEEIHHLVAEGKQMIEWYRYKLQEHIDLIWLPNRAVSNRVAGKRSQWDQHDHTDPFEVRFELELSSSDSEMSSSHRRNNPNWAGYNSFAFLFRTEKQRRSYH